MAGPGESLRAVLLSLWLRLATLTLIVFFILLTGWLPSRITGWFFYLTTGEVIFEVLVRAVAVALVALALSAILTALLAPFLIYRPSSRQRVANVLTRIAVGARGIPVPLGRTQYAAGESG